MSAPSALAPFETNSSLTVLSSEVNTPRSSPGPDGRGTSGVPVPTSVVLKGIDVQAPLEDQVAREPVFVSTPTSDQDGLYLTQDTPMNKAGFSYIPCALSPVPPPSPLWPFTRPIPTVARTADRPSQVHLSFIDRSAHLRISKDYLTVSTPLGFRSGRGNVPVRQGAWYCEMIVERGGGEPSAGSLDGSHVRLGWGRREAKLNSPVGLDGYSYGIRDKTGQKVTRSRPTSYLDKGFGTGDVVGMYIYLPEPPVKQAPSANDKGKGREIAPPMEVEVEEKKPLIDQDVSVDPTDLPSIEDANAASTSSLPVAFSRPPPNPLAPLHISRDRIPINYKSQLYFETVEMPPSKEMEDLMEPDLPAVVAPVATTTDAKKASGPRKPTTIKNKTLPSVDSMRKPVKVTESRKLPVLEKSKMAFFVNGKSPGVAFEDVFDYRPLRELKPKKPRGKMAHVINHRMEAAEDGLLDDGMMGYYPFVSTYGGGRVTFNPGPDFYYPPPDDIDAYLADPTGTHHTSTPARAKPTAPAGPSESPAPPPVEASGSASVEPAAHPPVAPSADPSEPAPDLGLSWAPLSSIYASHCALQQALDVRDEQFFIEDWRPDPEPVAPPPVEVVAPKRKLEGSSEPTLVASPAASASEPSPAPSASKSHKKKGAAGPKKSHHKKSRLGLHDGLVDSAAASELGGSSEASTPAAERPVTPPHLTAMSIASLMGTTAEPKPRTGPFVLPDMPPAEYFHPVQPPQYNQSQSPFSHLGLGGPFQRPSTQHYQQPHPQQQPHYTAQQQQQQQQQHRASHYPSQPSHNLFNAPLSARDLLSYPHSHPAQQQAYPPSQPYPLQHSFASQAGSSSYSPQQQQQSIAQQPLPASSVRTESAGQAGEVGGVEEDGLGDEDAEGELEESDDEVAG